MRTGVAGFGYYGRLSEPGAQLRTPRLLQPQEPAWRSRARLAPDVALQMPPFATINGFAMNQAQLTPAQLQSIQTMAQMIASSWRTMSPITSLRFSGFVNNNETAPQIDVQRTQNVRDALVRAIQALDANLLRRIRFEPDEPRGVTAGAPRVEIFAWAGITPPPARQPLQRIPPPGEGAKDFYDRYLEPRERIQRILRTLPPRPAGRSISGWWWNEVDTRLNSVMNRLNVPQELRGPIRDGAHAAIERGAEAIFNQVLDAAQLTGEPREALGTTVRALLQVPIQ
jgi:hypothetical protein